MAPRLPRAVTRIHGTARPFISVVGPGYGAISDLWIEHYFNAPLKLGVELAPLALALEPDGAGAIAHARAHVAYADDFLEFGVGVGGRLQHFGPSGMSLAATLRLGSLDGLHLIVENAFSLVDNYYTRRLAFSLSNVMASVAIPLSARLAIELAGGFGYDFWAYGTVGLRHRVHGNGGPGTLMVSGALGLTWVIDRFPCQYSDVTPCEGAASGLGPTIAVGLDRRF